MSVRSRRIAVAGVIAGMVIAVPAAAFASGASTPSGKPAPSAAASKPAPAGTSAPVKSPGPAQSGSAATKNAARGSRSVENATMPSMVAALAAHLGVSHSAAQRALDQINALGDRTGAGPASPAFAAIARDLGVSPARLAAALGAAKQAARQSVTGS